MDINDSFIVTNTMSFDGGIIPLGAIIKVQSIKDSTASVSIKPYLINELRTTKNTNMLVSFILENTTKIKTKE